MAESTEVHAIARMLHPYATKYGLTRIGPDGEFGYVVPDGLFENAKRVLSCGIGDNCDFENEVARRNKTAAIYCFDGTIESMPANAEPNLTFVKKNVGPINTEQTADLSTWCIPGTAVKMDIEGYEYSCFLGMSEYVLRDCIDVLCIEIHHSVFMDDIDMIHDTTDLAALLKKLESYMTLVHVHGNNGGPTLDYPLGINMRLPGLIEATFVSNRLVTWRTQSTSKYPIPGLDYPNFSNAPDIDMSWVTNF